MELSLPTKTLESRIYLIRGQRVMLDRDLASLYGVATKAFNQAVKRHRERFPVDFMFRLDKVELANWRSHFVTSNLAAWMGLRRAPFAFTEHGILMLSSVLNSERAVQVNIEIMRTFAKLRHLATAYPDLARRLDELESRYDAQFKEVFIAIRGLMAFPEKPRRRIGFKP